jgi:hypothetical protein
LLNGVCADSQDDVIITRNDPSVAPTGITGTTTICNGSSTTLTVLGGSAGTGAIAEWFTGSCGGTSAGTGNSITVSPTSNTTYFVRYAGTCNTTSCASQLVTVNPLHTISLSSGAATQTTCENTAITNIVYAIGGGATSAGITGLPTGVTGAYASGNFTISGTPTVSGVFNYIVTTTGNSCPNVNASGTITVNSLIDYANLQSPNTGSICTNGSFSAYGQVYEPGVTPAAGAGIGLVAEIGYSSINSNPNTWTNWSSATFNIQVGNNDEFTGTISGLTSGTYYYTFRYSLNGCAYQYGGSPNGFWNGTTQTSGVLTVFGTTITSGTVGGSAALTQCAGGNPGLFTVGVPSGGNGTYTYQWEQSDGCTGTWVNAIAEFGITNTLDFNAPQLNTVGTMCYRLKITDGCGSIGYSTTKTYTIVADPVSQTIVPTITNGSTICVGATVSATFTGGTGGTGTVVDTYEFSTNSGGSWSTYIPGTNITATAGMLGTNTIQIRTRRTATGTGCNDGTYNIVSYSVNQLDFGNLQFPQNATICASAGSFTVYGQVYEPGVTPGAGSQGAGITAELGYSTTDTYPNTWTNWQTATFNPAGGGTNNDEYQATLTGLSAGTYYYAYRYTINGCEFQYGGFSGGFWNGTSNVSGVLTVLTSVTFGTVTNSNETICVGDTPSNITLSAMPSGGSNSFGYQWYYQDGIVTCPTGTNPDGWTLISGATSSNYNPPALSSSRTYALMVDATGSPDCGVPTWASGCRQVTVIVCCIAPTSLTYTTNPVSYCKGVAISNNTASVDGTSPHTFSVSPALPSGLTLNTNNGTIIGTPNTLTAATNYTVTATNACGFTTINVNIAVTEPDCTISGNNGPVCPASTHSYSANLGMSNYSWTVNGNAGISGTSSNSTVNVLTGSNCNAAFTLSLTVTDSNGCTASCSKVVNVVDNAAPMFSSCPISAIELGCNPAAITSPQAIASAGAVTDACSTPSVTASGGIVNNTGSRYSQVWTITATDDCSNSTTCAVTYTWTQDIVKPDINTTASNANLGCNPTVTAPTFTGTDNCEGSITPIVTTTGATNTGCVFSQTWNANYTDVCGNIADEVSITYTWTIDTTPPTASNPANITLSGCNGTFPAPDITVVADEADNCSGTITVAHVSDGTPSLVGCTETTVRTYSVTDACGNSINVTQNLIRTVDITPPTASNPANITLSGCNGTFPAPDITVVADEADNCSGTITVAHVSDGTPSLVGCMETTVRTYSVTDACGNSINVTQNLIRTVDTTPPTASNPANITLSGCNGTFPTPDITVVADEADNCSGTITVAHVSDGTPSLVGCTETTVRTYSVTDACGNSINVTQNLIRTIDTTPPTASNPANITLSGCNGTFPAPDITVVADEADNCSGTITVAHVSDGTPSLVGCTETTVRTYSVTDACGNSINVTQNLIRTVDTTPPTASNPANIILSGCNGTFPAPNITVVADEADNCSGAITVAYISDGTPSLVGCTETTVRTYSVTDACGNSINVTQNLIRTVDTTPPTASNPANITLSGCNGTFPTPDITVVADEADNCSGTITVAYISDGTPSLVGCTETTVRTYSVTDACGNSINVTQNLIRTVDTTPPTASNPANITLSGCNGTFPTPDITVVADEADNCSGTITVAYISDGTPSLVGCTETTVRTYSVTDACGNSINVTQNLIRTVDTTPPTASNPANITLSGCNGTFPAPDITVVADEADNCSARLPLLMSVMELLPWSAVRKLRFAPIRLPMLAGTV